ncbi:hypothetical protein N0V83_003797 [Neocucurbitaria cava]|uniref:Aminoglycoside phosphotransferase domain-containing protein n=1 Tax=Neocucurbitaria cava TaxID=798079 RepID=A0A9W9CNH0_9PLEO|nr:hypothetical protein N0V83_003797 [Neocucurbitaria cava]
MAEKSFIVRSAHLPESKEQAPGHDTVDAAQSIESAGCDEGYFTEAKSALESEDDDSSATSSDSSAAWEQEPFTSFQHKVKRLFLKAFPGYGFADIRVDSIKGGSFNRVIGVTILEPHRFTVRWLQQRMRACIGLHVETRSEQYVVRIPRFDTEVEKMIDDIAALQFASFRLQLPVPVLIHFEVFAANAINSPYTIQTRLPGLHLSSLRLNLEQRKSLLRNVMEVQRQLNSVTNTSAGNITIATSSIAEVQLYQFEIPKSRPDLAPLPKYAATPCQSTFDLLKELCNRWKELYGLHNIMVDIIWNRVDIIISSLREHGFLPDTDQFYFCHTDFVGHNILVELRGDTDVDITAVLDWDSEWVFFAPKFVAYRAPLWLWNDMYDHGTYETKALLTPVDSDEEELKRTFEELADEEWLRYAFAPEFVVARRLFEILRSGAPGSEHWDEAKDIFKTWQEMYPETEGLVDDDSLYADSEPVSDSDGDPCSGSSSDEEYSEDENIGAEAKDSVMQSEPEIV